MDNIIIRSMKEEDSSEVLEMMKVFYASPALLSDPSEDVMKRDIADCLGDNPFIECFVFENNTGVIMGYSMVAHSYSTECGGNCVGRPKAEPENHERAGCGCGGGLRLPPAWC